MNMTQQSLTNLNILEAHVFSAIGSQTVTIVKSFFSQLFARNRWIRFDANLSDHKVVILFLDFLVRYWPEREYELVTGYPRLSFNRLLEKFIPLLQHFYRYEVCWGTFEIRYKRREYFSSTLPSGMKNVTLIVDAMWGGPLPPRAPRIPWWLRLLPYLLYLSIYLIFLYHLYFLL
jgi:hypothetical protein